jgi:transposase-like protein
MNKQQKFKIINEATENGVSITCKKHSISRTIYYKWLKRYQTYGIDGLEDIKKDFTPVNKTSKEIEESLFSLVKTYPTYGPRALKYLLEELDHDISESAVYNILKRHKLTNKKSRLRFSKQKENKMIQVIPDLTNLKSGECWLFWITDLGTYDDIGSIYSYTFFDVKSKIACTRLYHDISFSNLEDLLTGVALSVANSLNLEFNYLCFYKDDKVIKQHKNKFTSKLNTLLDSQGIDVLVHILNHHSELEDIKHMTSLYNQECITYLLPHIQQKRNLNEIRIKFQEFIRNYNMYNKIQFDNMLCSPVEYHNKQTDTKLILPLWAYMDREY